MCDVSKKPCDKRSEYQKRFLFLCLNCIYFFVLLRNQTHINSKRRFFLLDEWMNESTKCSATKLITQNRKISIHFDGNTLITINDQHQQQKMSESVNISQ